MKRQKILKIIFFLSILGIALSGYLIYLHYSGLNSPCDLSETFQCSLVNRSQYAEIFGIPVALLGLLGYSALGGISLNLWKKTGWQNKFLNKVNKFVDRFSSSKMLLVLSLIAVAMSLYLTYAEFFLIKAVCIFCLISQGTILGIVGLSYHHRKLSGLHMQDRLNELGKTTEEIVEELVE